MIENVTQIFITGILYNDEAFPSNPKELFNIIDEKIRNGIPLLTFKNSCINRSENRFSNSNVREQLMYFIQYAKYNNNEFLSDIDSETLRSQLITVFNNIDNVTYNDIEIRSSRIYS